MEASNRKVLRRSIIVFLCAFGLCFLLFRLFLHNLTAATYLFSGYSGIGKLSVVNLCYLFKEGMAVLLCAVTVALLVLAIFSFKKDIYFFVFALIFALGLGLFTIKSAVHYHAETSGWVVLEGVDEKNNTITVRFDSFPGETIVLHCTDVEAELLAEMVGTTFSMATYESYNQTKNSSVLPDGTHGNLTGLWLLPTP